MEEFQGPANNGAGDIGGDLDAEIESLISEIALLEFKRAMLIQLRRASTEFESQHYRDQAAEGLALAEIEQLI